jgi:hypothetical protein
VAKSSTTFQKGKSGHEGVMKETTLSGQLKMILQRTGDYETDVSNAKFAAQKLWDAFVEAQGLQDVVKGFEVIADRTEGKARQSTDITTDGEKINGIAVTFMAENDR